MSNLLLQSDKQTNGQQSILNSVVYCFNINSKEILWEWNLKLSSHGNRGTMCTIKNSSSILLSNSLNFGPHGLQLRKAISIKTLDEKLFYLIMRTVC